jgi:hypothetical protein
MLSAPPHQPKAQAALLAAIAMAGAGESVTTPVPSAIGASMIADRRDGHSNIPPASNHHGHAWPINDRIISASKAGMGTRRRRRSPINTTTHSRPNAIERAMNNMSSILILLIRYSPSQCCVNSNLRGHAIMSTAWLSQISLGNKKGALTPVMWGSTPLNELLAAGAAFRLSVLYCNGADRQPVICHCVSVMFAMPIWRASSANQLRMTILSSMTFLDLRFVALQHPKAKTKSRISY